VSGLAPGIYWLDSSELAAAAWQLGVAHPPGHGMAALLGKACTLLPLGPVAMRVGLASALCGALAAGRTAALGRRVSVRVRAAFGDATPRGATDQLLGAAAGLLFGLSYAAAFQAVRPEVYALSALLVVSAIDELAIFDEAGDRRRLYTGAVYAGLALTNHHLLALAALVPAVVFVIARRPQAPVAGAIARVCAAGGLGVAFLAYLPLRAARHPLVNWGVPSTWSRLYWTVSAQAFQKSVARGSTGDVPGVAAALAAQLHPVGALLALGGLYVMVRLPRLRRLGLLLCGAALCDAAMPALVGFDPANPDAYGYLEAAVALLAAAACALPAAIAARARAPAARQAVLAGSALLSAGAVVCGVLAYPGVTLAAQDDAARTLDGWLRPAPSRALAVTSYFQTIFGLFYLRSVEGSRPDVDLVHRHFLTYPGYRDELQRRRPELAPFLGARDLAPEASIREPLLVEYDIDLPDPLVHRATTPTTVGDLSEPQTRRFAAWQAFLAVHRACRVGFTAEIHARLAEARTLFGQSPELDQLAAKCLGTGPSQ
jgi:hypothetical protein